MTDQEREDLERNIRRRVEAGDLSGAVTAALRGYGPEILRFLLVLHPQEQDASEVFSLFAEGVWRRLGGFAWECSFRTWAYAVARRCSLRHRRDAGRRARRQVALDDVSALSAIEEEVRTATLSFLRSEARDRFAELREALPPDDQALLVLRVDRQLAWNDLAHAMHEDEAVPLSGEALKREAARLRQRFQTIKERLVAIGRSEGLIGPGKAPR
jgi:RNA polymerase sigma-70 factor (ECF subfamily)